MMKMLAIAIVISIVAVAGYAHADRWLAHRALNRLVAADSSEAGWRSLADRRFVEAACDDDKPTLRLFLRARYSPDAMLPDGTRPLHCAAMRGDLDLSRALLDLGADPNVSRNDGVTPMHYAAAYHHLDMVKLLRERGADINRPSDFGSPLMVALNQVDGARKGPPYWIGKIRIVRDIPNPLANVLEELVALGARTDTTDKHGNGLLHVAASTLNRQSIDALIDKGADLNAPNRKGETPFMLAVRNARFGKPGKGPTPDLDLIRHLLDRDPRIKINARTVDGRTIMFDLMNAPDDAIDLLLGRGLDVNVALDDGTPVWHTNGPSSRIAAIADKFRDVGMPLRPNGSVGRGPLHVYARAGDAELVAYFLKRGLHADAADHEGNTPLHEAVSGAGGVGDWRAKRIDIVLRLLAAGAKINARNHRGETPLMHAAEQPVEILQLLIDKGADVNAIATGTGGDMHVLDRFQMHGNTAGVTLLLRAGARKKQ